MQNCFFADYKVCQNNLKIKGKLIHNYAKFLTNLIFINLNIKHFIQLNISSLKIVHLKIKNAQTIVKTTDLSVLFYYIYRLLF